MHVDIDFICCYFQRAIRRAIIYQLGAYLKDIPAILAFAFIALTLYRLPRTLKKIFGRKRLESELAAHYSAAYLRFADENEVRDIIGAQFFAVLADLVTLFPLLIVTV